MKQVSAANKNINCLENYQFRILSQFPEAPHELSVHKSSSTVLQNTATEMPQLLVHCRERQQAG